MEKISESQVNPLIAINKIRMQKHVFILIALIFSQLIQANAQTEGYYYNGHFYPGVYNEANHRESSTTTNNYNYYDYNFEEEQLGYVRVWQARHKKEPVIQQQFAEKGLAYPPQGIFIRVFKIEMILEVWVKDASGYHTKFKDYKLCARTGSLGPKRMQGDKQMPEGFYQINEFNPRSSFLLSLGINYPNVSDRLLGVQGNLGGDIYIHGGCLSIGCVAIDNNNIEEVYWLAVQARQSGQFTIPVHIFPFKFNEPDRQLFFTKYPQHHDFWMSLKAGYDRFESTRMIPEVFYNDRGIYEFW